MSRNPDQEEDDDDDDDENQREDEEADKKSEQIAQTAWKDLDDDHDEPERRKDQKNCDDDQKFGPLLAPLHAAGKNVRVGNEAEFHEGVQDHLKQSATSKQTKTRTNGKRHKRGKLIRFNQVKQGEERDRPGKRFVRDTKHVTSGWWGSSGADATPRGGGGGGGGEEEEEEAEVAESVNNFSLSFSFSLCSSFCLSAWKGAAAKE